jgi:hypothetical protein
MLLLASFSVKGEKGVPPVPWDSCVFERPVPAELPKSPPVVVVAALEPKLPPVLELPNRPPAVVPLPKLVLLAVPPNKLLLGWLAPKPVLALLPPKPPPKPVPPEVDVAVVPNRPPPEDVAVVPKGFAAPKPEDVEPKPDPAPEVLAVLHQKLVLLASAFIVFQPPRISRGTPSPDSNLGLDPRSLQVLTSSSEEAIARVAAEACALLLRLLLLRLLLSKAFTRCQLAPRHGAGG